MRRILRSTGCPWAFALAAAFTIAAPAPARAQARPVVAAASDLQFALVEIEAAFEKAGGSKIDLVFGSSGNLTTQIQQGAPFQIFLSADESFVRDLAKAGLTKDGGVLYAVGRIVLFAPPGSPLKPDAELKNLADLVAAHRVDRFAIANPAHAPYGRAAEAALRKRGIWDAIQPALVLGENVSQAAQFATTGNAAGGLIAYSLAVSPTFRDRGTFALIPETDHPPLLQRMVRTIKAGPEADRFYAFLQSATAREIFTRYGFSAPPAGR